MNFSLHLQGLQRHSLNLLLLRYIYHFYRVDLTIINYIYYFKELMKKYFNDYSKILI